jgi:LysM repeat protein
MLRQIKTKIVFTTLIIIVVSLGLTYAALAQVETPYDLVSAVNNLRALYGLVPYQIDPTLMDYAQEHSEYQASIRTGTHTHSDGTLPQNIGLQENVAGGDAGVVTVAIVVNEIWVDWGHRHILIDYPSGEIGAGVALSDNGQVYYTLVIRPGEAAEAVSTGAITPVTVIQLRTSTPNLNGSIIHKVNSGESLWSIAELYGFSLEELRGLNNLVGESPIINIGQELLIRPALTVTPVHPMVTPSISPLNQKLTATQFAGDVSSTMAAKSSPSSTMAPPLTTNSKTVDNPSSASMKIIRVGLITLLAVSVLGLLLAVVFGLRRSGSNEGIEDR